MTTASAGAKGSDLVFESLEVYAGLSTYSRIDSRKQSGRHIDEAHSSLGRWLLQILPYRLQRRHLY